MHPATIRNIGVVALLVLALGLIFIPTADAGGDHWEDKCKKYPWKCPTTTTTTSTPTTSSTTSIPETTTTAPTTTTLIDTTTTTEPEQPTTTTTPAPSTTAPTPPSTVPDQTAQWSAEATCDTLSVEFGENIIAVTVWDHVTVLDEFLASGERTITVGAPLTLEVIPVTNPGIIADPESRTFTFRPCTEPTLTIPDDPADPVDPEEPLEELPFTGIESELAYVAAALLLFGGLILMAVRGRAEVEQG